MGHRPDRPPPPESRSIDSRLGRDGAGGAVWAAVVINPRFLPFLLSTPSPPAGASPWRRGVGGGGQKPLPAPPLASGHIKQEEDEVLSHLLCIPPAPTLLDSSKARLLLEQTPTAPSRRPASEARQADSQGAAPGAGCRLWDRRRLGHIFSRRETGPLCPRVGWGRTAPRRGFRQEPLKPPPRKICPCDGHPATATPSPLGAGIEGI